MSSPPPREPRSEAGGSLIRKVDVCRGLFAFLVVAAHSYDACWVVHFDAVNAMSEPTRNFLHATLQAGAYWVMGFFVISGYCIQLSVGRLIDSGRFPLGIYLAARLSRIAPLYYAGLLFALAVETVVSRARPDFYPDGIDEVGFLSQMVFAQRLVRTFGAFAPSWTITNEMFYYVLFGGLALLAGGRRGRPAWIGMGLCVVVAGALQCLHAAGARGPLFGGIGLMLGLGINWFLGALVAAHGASLVRLKAVRAAAIAWPLAFLAGVALKASGRCPEQAIALVMGVAFSLMMLRFVAVADAEAASGVARPAPRWLASLAETLGLASYPTYLFHGPILLLIATAIHRWDLIEDWRATWAVLVISGIGFGVVLGLVAERPIMAWRAGFLKRLKDRSVATGPEVTLPTARRPTLTQGA